MPAKKKLKQAFALFNQFKVAALNRHQTTFLMAWLGRVTYQLRYRMGIESFYPNNSGRSPHTPPIFPEEEKAFRDILSGLALH